MSLSAKPVKTTYTLASYTIAITLSSQDFYFSHQNDLDSPLGGKPSFGWGQCPNQKYRTEFTVQNSEGQNVPDAQLTVSKGGQQIPDAAPGKAVYLYNGDYTAAAQADGQQGSKDFKVNDEAQTVTVQLVKGADEPDNPPSGKLATPTNLTWGRDQMGTSLPGALYWEQANNINCTINIYQVHEGSTDLRIGGGGNWPGRGESSFFMTDIEAAGSGTFYFTVQAIGDGKTTFDSDIATSDKWVYTVPQKQIATVITQQKSGNLLVWNPLPDESQIHEYIVDYFYSETIDGEKKRCGGSRRVTQESNGTYTHDFSSRAYGQKEGYYFLRVKAIPKDMTQYRSSEWSEFSEPYHYVPEP